MTAANNPDQPGARMPCETRKVFGFSVAVSSVEEMSSALAERALEAQAPCLVAAADVHVITLGVHDRGYGAVLERMDVVCPDGMPVVWKLNRGLPAGERSAERVSGPDLRKPWCGRMRSIRVCAIFCWAEMKGRWRPWRPH